MNFYYFHGFNHMANDINMDTLENHGFTGALFVYNSWAEDYISLIARDIDLSKKIKYMVAIRPYSISPQYLVMMNKSINSIMENRLEINLISGHIKEWEKQWGGIKGTVHDQSDHIARSNYMIKYLEELDKKHKAGAFELMPDIWVATTNKYVFETASTLNYKMIISYEVYKQGHWIEYETYPNGLKFLGDQINLKNQRVMISVCPVIRATQEELQIAKQAVQKTNDTEYFTNESFITFIEMLQSKEIHDLLINPPVGEEYQVIEFIKKLQRQKESFTWT